MQIILRYLLCLFFSIINSYSKLDPKDKNLEVVVLVNNFLLTKDDINTIQQIYKTEKNTEISSEEIFTLVTIYHYLCYFTSANEIREMLTEQPPSSIIEQCEGNQSLSNTLVLLWNRDLLYRGIEDMAVSNEKNLEKRKRTDFFWQYIMISGEYTHTIPNNQHFSELLGSNFSPEQKLKLLEKKYGFKHLKVTFNEFQEWDRKNFIDKTNKTFSIIIHKSKMYSNIRYELIIYEYPDAQQAVEGFEIIKNNSAILPEQIPNLMKYKNLQCKMTRTSMYSQEMDSGLAIVLNNLPITQYSLIDNSYYVLYITAKTYCEENQETKEERKALLVKQYIAKIIDSLNHESLVLILQQLDHVLYE